MCHSFHAVITLSWGFSRRGGGWGGGGVYGRLLLACNWNFVIVVQAVNHRGPGETWELTELRSGDVDWDSESPHVTDISPCWESITKGDLKLDLMKTAASWEHSFHAVYSLDRCLKEALFRFNRCFLRASANELSSTAWSDRPETNFSFRIGDICSTPVNYPEIVTGKSWRFSLKGKARLFYLGDTFRRITCVKYSFVSAWALWSASTSRILALPLGCCGPLRAENRRSQRTSFHSLHWPCMSWLTFPFSRNVWTD